MVVIRGDLSSCDGGSMVVMVITFGSDCGDDSGNGKDGCCCGGFLVAMVVV